MQHTHKQMIVMFFSVLFMATVGIIVLSATAAAGYTDLSVDKALDRQDGNKYGYDYSISIDGLIFLIFVILGLFLLNSAIEWHDNKTGPKPHIYDTDAIDAIRLTPVEQKELDAFKESDECIYAYDSDGLVCWKIDQIVANRITEDETPENPPLCVDDYGHEYCPSPELIKRNIEQSAPHNRRTT